MTIQELKEKYGFNSKARKVHCFKCRKELEIPNLLSEKLRKEVLHPYCPAGTVFTVGWLINHGWHCTRHEAEGDDPVPGYGERCELISEIKRRFME